MDGGRLSVEGRKMPKRAAALKGDAVTLVLIETISVIMRISCHAHVVSLSSRMTVLGGGPIGRKVIVVRSI